MWGEAPLVKVALVHLCGILLEQTQAACQLHHLLLVPHYVLCRLLCPLSLLEGHKVLPHNTHLLKTVSEKLLRNL